MMTSSAVHSIDAYQFSSTDALLFDANVWLYLYGPTTRRPSAHRYRTYSGALKRIINAECRIFIDVLVLSEFVNRYARLVHHVMRGVRKEEFKEWRNSHEFTEVARDIANVCRRIVNLCEPTDSGFESVDLPALLTRYEKDHSDFNDLVLVELCRAKGLALVTHDADFRAFDIPLLTANQKLLKL